MKEFMLKHPILSYLLGAAAIEGVVKIVRTVSYAISGKEGLAPNQVKISYNGKDAKEENADESANDIQ